MSIRRFALFLAAIVVMTLSLSNPANAAYICEIAYTSCNAVSRTVTKTGPGCTTETCTGSCTPTTGSYCSSTSCNPACISDPCPVTCPAGQYLNNASCTSCGGNGYYCPGGTWTPNGAAQGRNSVSAGYYSTGGDANTRTGQSQCTGATWCSAGVQTTCPAGYTADTTAGKTAASQCQISCGAGDYVATANAACTDIPAAGYRGTTQLTNYGSTGSYSSCDANYQYNTATGKTAVTQCQINCAAGNYVATANAACTAIPAAGYRGTTQVTNYGSTGSYSGCDANYQYNTATGKTAATQCQINCAAGEYVATANADCTAIPAAGYRGTTQVTNYGSTGSYSSCDANYQYNTATGKTAVTQCQINCAAGNYVATANAACTAIPVAGFRTTTQTINYGSTGTYTTCPTNYEDGTTTGKTAQTQCQISCDAGNYVATANAACTSIPAAGYRSTTQLTNYGSTGSYSSCDANYQYNTATGKTAVTQCQINCAAGNYVATANAACTAIPVAGFRTTAQITNYGSTGTYTTCPTNYDDGSTTGKTAQSQCQTNCAAGQYVATANTACAAIPAVGYRSTTQLTNYGSTGSYSTCDANYQDNTATGKTAVTQCEIDCAAGQYVAAANAACTAIPVAGFRTTAQTTSYGSTGTYTTCPTNYDDGSVTGKTAQTQCQTNCVAGTRVATANAACTTPTGSWYSGAHLVNYGNLSTVSSCIANYATASTTAATDHDNFNDCKQTCSAGYYIATTTSACAAVGDGYYRDGSATVNQVSTTDGQTLARNVCGGNQYYCTGGARNNVSAGYYSTGGDANTRSGQSQCTGATWCSGGVQNTCPTNYTANTTAGKTLIGQCQISCSAGSYLKTANDSTCTIIPQEGYRSTAQATGYGSTGGYDTCDINYRYNTATGKDAQSDCQINCSMGQYVAATGAACSDIPAEGWRSTAQTTNYGAVGSYSLCDASYRYNTVAGKTIESQCQIQCAAGYRIATANAACSVPSGSWYSSTHVVNFGSLSTVSSCIQYYATANTTTYTDHDAYNDCKQTCNPGYYLASATSQCATVSGGYYRAGVSTVSQTSIGAGQSLARIACVLGSYSSSETGSSCIACGNGTTTSTSAKTSCDTACANDDFVATWSAASWVSNSVTNLCTIATCIPGYVLEENQCNIVTYGIVYNLNSGTHGTTHPDTYQVTTPTIVVSNPTRTGYTFAGWCENSGLTLNCAVNKQIPIGSTGNREYWAKWTANTYTISFSGNGYTSGSIPSTINCTYDVNCQLPQKGTIIRQGYIWTKWCTAANGTGTCQTGGNNVLNLSATSGANVTMYAIWAACGPSTYSDTAANVCTTCVEGKYSVGAANPSCGDCETGYRCNAGIRTACSGINEWQELTGKNYCDPVPDGYQKNTNDAIKVCGVASFCKNGVRTLCPTKTEPGTANETTLSATSSLITECFQARVDCIPTTGGLGDKFCYYHPAVGRYCWPAGHENYGTDGEDCYLTECSADQHNTYSGCTSNVQVCTSPEVGLTGAGVAGNAEFKVSGWDKSGCYATGLIHEGAAVHGSGTKSCNYTSGSGAAAIFKNSCTNYNLTSCDAGYYRYAPSDDECVPVTKGYYSVVGSITREACPDGGTTDTDTTGSITGCVKTSSPFDGTHCDGRQKCWWGGTAYDKDCEVFSITSCDAGYYYYNDDTDNAPNGTPAPRGYYSVAESIVAMPCPDGGTTETPASSSIDQCYKPCTAPAAPANATAIVPTTGKAYYEANQYEQCKFTVTCETGFTPVLNNSMTPTCARNNVTINFDKNGEDSIETMNPLNCSFGTVCSVPDNNFKRPGYVFDKWCTGSDGTGTCVSAGNNVGSLIPGGAVTLYAQWVVCDNGKYSTAGNSAGRICQTCSPGSYTPDDNLPHAACTLCGAGYYQPNNGANTCTSTVNECPEGTFNTGFGNVTCEYCSVGTYNSLRAQSSCLSAGFGKHTLNCLDTTAWEGCRASTNCELGTYSDISTAGKTCRACPQGTFAAETGQDQCDVCPAGAFCPGDGASHTCSPGKYCEPNSTVEVTCPAGKFCPAGSGGLDSIGDCLGGYYCPAGSINNKGHTVGGATDKICAAGYYCPAGSNVAQKNLCPWGSYCPAGSAAPIQCPAHNACLEDGRSAAVCAPGFELKTAGDGSVTCGFKSEACTIGTNGYGSRNLENGTCTLTGCSGDNHISADGLRCEPNIVACTTTNGMGNKIWSESGDIYSQCMETSCNIGYGLDTGECVACGIANVLAYKSRTDGSCVVDSCKSGFHLVNNQCVPNVESCADGKGKNTWENGTWSGCVLYDCEAGYHIKDNVCVANKEPCTVENGSGFKYWIGSSLSGRWGECEATSCWPGYTSDRGQTNEWTKQCGRCNNFYGSDGLQAVSSYVSGCEIALCMHQGEKYILQAGECVQICETKSDETGTMMFNTTTNKCQRTCNTNSGYIPW